MTQSPRKERSASLFSNLPPLPAVARYYDDFSDTYDEISDLTAEVWTVHFDGGTKQFNFLDIDRSIRDVVMRWCAFVLGDLSPITASSYLDQFKRIPPDLIVRLATCEPRSNLRSEWNKLRAGAIGIGAFGPVSNFLAFLCRFSIGDWNPSWLDIISQLPRPKYDKYASVRVGDVFLSLDEENAIIRHIDDMCQQIAILRSALADDLVESTAILLCSYQFGFRSKQIAMLEMRNIKIWDDGIDEYPAVHLTFSMIKQRSSKCVFPMPRRIKREWSAIFVEVFERAKLKGLAGADHVFSRTPQEISVAISDLTKSLGHRRGATELRHTSAQRLVDAGASEEELAEFMGHSCLDTGLVYFNSSRSQAQRINQALGLSSTYQNVLKVAHGRFISLDELVELKGDHQVAGVPHGVPIAGIGGCEVGQPSCPKNPIMSCYGCNKFMPIASVAIHLRVLEDVREIMKFFYASSYAERGSPAFQLQDTIAKVQTVIDELGGQRNELDS
jgi:integrase